MNPQQEISFKGYLKYFYRIVGNKLIYNFFASVLLGVLDSIGIGFLVGVLQIVLNPDSTPNDSILGRINQTLDVFGFGGMQITQLIYLAIGIYVIKSIVYYLQLRLQSVMNSTIINSTRIQMVQSITGLSYRGFISLDAGTVQNISTMEVNRLNGAMLGFFNTTQYIIMALTYLILALFTEFYFALLLISIAAIILYFYRFIIRYFKKLSSEISSSGNVYNSYLSQLLYNFKYLKSTNNIKAYSQRIIHEIKKAEHKALNLWKMTAITSSVREPMVIIIVSLVIFIQYRISGAMNSVTIFTLLLFYRTLNYLLITQSHWQSFHQYSGSIHNILQTQDLLYKYEESAKGKQFKLFENHILLSNVALSLGNQEILKDINLNIEKNTTVALVGKSGAGKSTLAAILSALFIPDNGVFSIDNEDIKNFDLTTYRQKIGYVTQDPVIFNDSIYNNISLWKEEDPSTMQQIHNIIEIAELKDFVQRLDRGIHTIVGDNGIILSGGQKQRIAIARELFKNPQLLILDEATSSLDSSTESLIQRNLDKLSGKTTIVVIAHRLSTIKKANTIYVLNEGKIEVSGTFEELMATSSSFRNMAAQQKH